MNINIILTALTIVMGVIAIVTFFNCIKKENKPSSEKTGKLRTDLNHIKGLLVDVRAEIKEIIKAMDDPSEEITNTHKSVASAHKRIDEAIHRVEHLEQKYRGEFQ